MIRSQSRRSQPATRASSRSRARALLAELQDFRAELLRIAALLYLPKLDDGVIINAALLHKLFRLPKRAKDTRETGTKHDRRFRNLGPGSWGLSRIGADGFPPLGATEAVALV